MATYEINTDIITNTTWKSNNIYIITKTIEVINTAVLTIEPNVIVNFRQDNNLVVRGGIVANGSKDQLIIFQNEQKNYPSPSGGLSLESPEQHWAFKYCWFRYNEQLLSIYNAAIIKKIEYCKFEDAMHGVLITNSSPQILNCEFNRLKQTGVTFKNNCSSLMEYCIILNVDVAVRVTNSATPEIRRSTFDNNTFGIEITDKNTNPVVKNNIFVNHQTALHKTVEATISETYNLFWNNDLNADGFTLHTSDITNQPPLLNSDYTLQQGSPCVDAGDPVLLDIDGTRSDIGAKYYHQTKSVTSVSSQYYRRVIIPQGKVERLYYHFYTIDKRLTDPLQPTLTVRQPDGQVMIDIDMVSLENVTPIRESTGIYYYLIKPAVDAVIGEYTAWWSHGDTSGIFDSIDYPQFIEIIRKEHYAPLLLPIDIRNNYCFGLPLVSCNGAPIDDYTILEYIRSAEDELKRELDLYWRLTKVITNPAGTLIRGIDYDETDDAYDFERLLFTRWGFLQLRKFPVQSILRFEFKYANYSIINFDLSWIKLNRRHGQIQIVPTSIAYLRIQSAMYPMVAMLTGRGFIPHFVEVDYIAGLEKIPQDLVTAVGKLAAIQILSISADALKDAKEQRSVTVDGISRSWTPSEYATRIKRYEKEIEEFKKEFRRYYKGIPLKVL